MTTGQRIRMRRKEIGLSAERVAELLGVSPATIYRYENGDIEKVPGDSLAPIAQALNTTPAALMGWCDCSNSETPAIYPASAAPVEPLSKSELALLNCFRLLDSDGQQKVMEYATDLCASGRYIKTTSDNSIPKQA